MVRSCQDRVNKIGKRENLLKERGFGCVRSVSLGTASSLSDHSIMNDSRIFCCKSIEVHGRDSWTDPSLHELKTKKSRV